MNHKARLTTEAIIGLSRALNVLATLLIFVALTTYGATKMLSDSEIAAALVSTWTDAPSENRAAHSKASYYADGKGVEFVWPAGLPESSAVRVETRWSVTNQVLVIKSVASSDTRIVPVGIELHDRILSISQDQYNFQPEGYADQKRHTRIRDRNIP